MCGRICAANALFLRSFALILLIWCSAACASVNEQREHYNFAHIRKWEPRLKPTRSNVHTHDDASMLGKPPSGAYSDSSPVARSNGVHVLFPRERNQTPRVSPDSADSDVPITITSASTYSRTLTLQQQQSTASKPGAEPFRSSPSAWYPQNSRARRAVDPLGLLPGSDPETDTAVDLKTHAPTSTELTGLTDDISSIMSKHSSVTGLGSSSSTRSEKAGIATYSIIGSIPPLPSFSSVTPFPGVGLASSPTSSMAMPTSTKPGSSSGDREEGYDNNSGQWKFIGVAVVAFTSVALVLLGITFSDQWWGKFLKPIVLCKRPLFGGRKRQWNDDDGYGQELIPDWKRRSWIVKVDGEGQSLDRYPTVSSMPDILGAMNAMGNHGNKLGTNADCRGLKMDGTDEECEEDSDALMAERDPKFLAIPVSPFTRRGKLSPPLRSEDRTLRSNSPQTLTTGQLTADLGLSPPPTAPLPLEPAALARKSSQRTQSPYEIPDLSAATSVARSGLPRSHALAHLPAQPTVRLVTPIPNELASSSQAPDGLTNTDDAYSGCITVHVPNSSGKHRDTSQARTTEL